MAINVITISGRLTKDPELKSTKTGKRVCGFTIASDKRGKDAGTNFVDCIAWEGRGETISKYFQKGSPITIMGRLDQQAWKASDGSNRTKLIIIVDDFIFMEKREESLEAQAEKMLDSAEEITLDNIPFN